MGQKHAAVQIVSELLTVEKYSGANYLPLYEDRVDDLASDTPPLLAKLPAGKLKQYLSLAVGVHEDTVTVIDECAKYKYYDLIQGQQTPKILQKYHLPISLQSNLPYGQLQPGTVALIKTTLWQIAAILRQRAQSLLS